MGDLSNNFSRHEFACGDGCGWDTVDYALLEALETRREATGIPIHITSGARCVHHNDTVGGALTSQHLAGRAADIVEEGVPPSETQDYFESVGLSVGRYPGFTHIDTRSGPPKRWSK